MWREYRAVRKWCACCSSLSSRLGNRCSSISLLLLLRSPLFVQRLASSLLLVSLPLLAVQASLLGLLQDHQVLCHTVHLRPPSRDLWAVWLGARKWALGEGPLFL